MFTISPSSITKVKVDYSTSAAVYGDVTSTKVDDRILFNPAQVSKSTDDVEVKIKV